MNAGRLHAGLIQEVFAIGEDDIDATHLAWRLIEPVFPSIVDRFYADPFMQAHTSGFSPQRLQALKTKQQEHWRQVLTSSFDETYILRVRRAAIAHRVIGIRGSTIVIAYQLFLRAVLDELRDGFSLRGDVLERVSAAIAKVIAVDTAITIDAYESELLAD